MKPIALIAGAVAVGWSALCPLPAGAQRPDTAVVRAGDAGGPPGTIACGDGRITGVEVRTRPIFDPSSTRVSLLKWAYRTANLLHVRTSPSFVRRELLFRAGDCYDSLLVSESERILDSYRFLSEARVTTTDDGAGGRRVEVDTRDEWSTQIDIGVSYDQGLNLERFQATELNFLGQGVFAEYTRRNRLEHKNQTFGLSTPRFFGRTDASIEGGTTRAGNSFAQAVRYPFVGETGRVSVQESYARGTDFFSYATDGAAAYSHALLPVTQENFSLSWAGRFGPPDRAWLLGLTVSRDAYTFTRDAEAAFGWNFDDRIPITEGLPPSLARQREGSAATRLTLHTGMRRLHYAEYVGLDAVSDRQLVGLGLFAGASVGHSIDVLTPSRGVPVTDAVGRAFVQATGALGPSLFQLTSTVEGRRDDGAWRDVQGEANAVVYLRGSLLPAQTLLLRAAGIGGWDTQLPFQLTLGGRKGVRSLADDRYPGGRELLFIAEDRVRLDALSSDAMDVGATVFGDLGRMWPGDVPFGVDSGWQGAVGFGLRLGFPSGTRNVYRPDIVFPLGPGGGSPIFRVTLELNRLRSGFSSPDLRNSRRLDVGVDRFSSS